MRIQPWMTAVTGALLLLGAPARSMGQMPPVGYGAPGMAAVPGGYQAPPPYSPGGSADPNVLWPPGTPPDFQPWPQISPFHSANVGMDQHANRDGLWFRELFYKRREYYASVEPMLVY